MILLQFLILLLVSVALADDLVSVVVLFRHGDRSILTSFPKDPYQDISYWPEGYGQLLEYGRTRHYYLGQWFQNRYDGFISKPYKKSDILVYSSDSDRCLMSAAANLAGMYRVDSKHQWVAGLPWEPVPIHNRPEEEDPFLALAAPCARRNALNEEQKQSQYFRDIAKQNSELFKYLSEKTGWDIDDIHYIETLQSVMYVYSQHNTSYIPDWYTSLNSTHIQYLAGLSFARFTFTPELKKLVAGPLINKLLNYFDQIMENKDKTPKFLMLSAHDSTVAAILNAMENYDNHPPEFAATVIWEMYKNSSGTENGYYIKMYYKKYYWPGLQLLSLDGCGEECDYTTYKKIVGSFRINETDWQTQCDQKL